MSAELINVLFKRRSKIDNVAETWESDPRESNADAKHLADLPLGAPSQLDWVRSLDPTPEEDTLAEALSEALEERGSRPAHSPKDVDTEAAKLRELAEALHKMQEKFNAEREQLGGKREELVKREAELKAREEALKVAQEEQRRQEETQREYPIPDWMEREKLEHGINIGVVGNTGVGKSLLINRLRRIRPHAEGWAPVGVNETTMAPTMYAFKGTQSVRLWDLPGAGTEAFPSGTYIQSMGLRYFDKVVIVSAGRFTSTEVALRTELEKHEVPFCMVRTKIDIDIYNNAMDNNLDEQATCSAIRNDMRGHGVDNPFLVSLRDPDAHDFPKLMCTLFPGLKKELDPNAPAFYPSAPGWSEPWAMPVALSMTLTGMQGRWYDNYGAMYMIAGAQAHVALKEGQNAIVDLAESSDGTIWWTNRWFVDNHSVNLARISKELRWTPVNMKQDRPLVWYWAD
eukprot:TRINITY_DN29378_c0_g1_i1.p1 TRINITY_DN29378_c0_g1~~TRINITY_DN29378_c0_g1_i1.p1  ORF type:complete len:474 (-),score=91.13 TRINITY_DN29378_c0_g1_i1:441-1811(-)